MATRTRVPTKTIQDLLAGAIDVIDRADRLLGKVDLIRYMGILCGPANPIDTQTIVGGVPVDPRARTWVLNQLTDSVQVAPLLGGVWDVSDRWARQLGQVDLARVLGGALTSANPVIAGIYDALGNRMPSMDAVARPGYVDVIDRAARLLGTVSPVAGSVWDVSDRWARQLGAVDLARVLGAALSAANPVISGIYDAAGNRMPAMDASARPGYVDVIDRAGRALGIVASITADVGIKDNGNVITVDGTLTQSTKHDATTYKNAYVKLTADGNIVAGVANKLLYVHWVKVVMGADTEGEVYDKSGGNIIDHLVHNDREGFVSGFAPYPAAVWKSQISEELYFDLTSATGEAYFTIIYSEQDT